MSHQLWRFFLEDDLESFKKLLANAGQRSVSSKNSGAGRGAPTIGSPSSKTFSTSPNQTRKSLGTPAKGKGAQNSLSRADLNARDYQGLTLLHWIVSSSQEDATEYALALLDQPMLDLAAQDAESAWTALHRALYFGNVTIARALLNRDHADIGGFGAHSSAQAGPLIKIKDQEGNSPFDLYNSSIVSRKLKAPHENAAKSTGQDDTASVASDTEYTQTKALPESQHDGDELFMFGSNKNLNLGVGDEDDRQFPERITLKRPKHLLQHLHLEHLIQSFSRKNRLSDQEQLSESLDMTGGLPDLVRFSPMTIKDVQLSKLHTAILTDDPMSNLYMCGFGPGGRLGTGDEATRFSFSCIYTGGLQRQKVVRVGLGQNHTLAITAEGEVYSWGSNGYGQLGYSLAVTKDEEPIQLVPRQIFGPLKREKAIGCAASRIHSVIFTSETLYTFGKNEGQLGLIDSDARSLEMQTTPRAVAASLFPVPILQATAIDKATACLLENHEVYVFANYGYTRVKIPLLNDFSNYFREPTYSTARYGINGPNRVTKICSGGDTICALARDGQVFTFNIRQSVEPSGKASTTNPAKIRNALSEPQKIWSLRKDSMACTDVNVGQDGSIIICTKSGSVWRRVSRVKAKGTSAGTSGAKGKDYKFSRVPGLTRISEVRSNAFGSFAAIRQDWDVLQTQVHVSESRIWQDVFDMCPFKAMKPEQPIGRLEIQVAEPGQPDVMNIRRAVLETKDLESIVSVLLIGLDTASYNMSVGSTLSNIRIPCHEFLLAGRSSPLRHGLAVLRESYHFKLSDTINIEFDEAGRPLILFQGLDILTLFNLVLYLYTDRIVDVWHYTRHAPAMTVRYKQARVELQKTAEWLGLKDLETSTRLQVFPRKTLNRDFEKAYITPEYFEAADIEIELDGGSFHAHSALLVRRCPFFEGMFAGHSGGGWMKSRYEGISEDSEKLVTVDMKHVEPHIFEIVLRFMYADTGTEIFDEVAVSDLDSFLDIVIDVMSVANELMIDRLAEVCQSVLGRFANVRNVCQLLNAVAPCSVNNFKQAALEYICLNLEIMLENHLLDELDEDLMLELDEVVRDNQNACFEYTRRGETASEALLERYPDLAERLDFSRRRKIDSMRLHAKRLQREEEEKLAQASKSPKIAPKSPKLRGKSSAHDLLFDMDEDGNRSPSFRPIEDRDRRPSRLSLAGDESPWLDNRGKMATSTSPGPTFGSLNEIASPKRRATDQTIIEAGPSTPSKSGAPWGSVPLSSEKLDMKLILAQADERKTSGISTGLSSQTGMAAKFKVSQKERRKQIQDQQKRQAEMEAESKVSNGNSKAKVSAWQPVSAGSKVSLKDIAVQPKAPPVANTPPARPTPALTMRQTVSGVSAGKKLAMPASPDTKPQSAPKPPGRSVSSPQVGTQSVYPSSSTKVRTVPRPPSPEKTDIRPLARAIATSPSASLSVRHQPAPVEPSLQLSMADILTQQQLEKEVIKEAVAKRSLQEIQEEQAFQEWWDAEEKATRERLQAEQHAASASTGPKRGGRAGRGRGGGGNLDRGGKSKGPSRARGGRSRGGGSDNQHGRGEAGTSSTA